MDGSTFAVTHFRRLKKKFIGSESPNEPSTATTLEVNFVDDSTLNLDLQSLRENVSHVGELLVKVRL